MRGKNARGTLRSLCQTPISSTAFQDAMAEGDTVGIGGWLCTKDGLHWFSEIWSMPHVREVWPQLHKDAQKYIACFETLAQLALLQMAHSRVARKYLSFAVRLGQHAH